MEIRDFLERWREAGGAERANKDLFLAELRDLLAEAGELDLAAARAAFGRAPAAPVRAALDSLVAVGLAVRAGEGAAASWSAVRS